MTFGETTKKDDSHHNMGQDTHGQNRGPKDLRIPSCFRLPAGRPRGGEAFADALPRGRPGRPRWENSPVDNTCNLRIWLLTSCSASVCSASAALARTSRAFQYKLAAPARTAAASVVYKAPDRKSQLFSTCVVHKEQFGRSSWNFATFQYKCGLRSTLWRLARKSQLFSISVVYKTHFGSSRATVWIRHGG